MTEVSSSPSGVGSGPASTSQDPRINSGNTPDRKTDVMFERTGTMSARNGFALFTIGKGEFYASRFDVKCILKNLERETRVYTNKIPQTVLFGEQKKRNVGRVIGTYSGKSIKLNILDVEYIVNAAKAFDVIEGNAEYCPISRIIQLHEVNV